MPKKRSANPEQVNCSLCNNRTSLDAYVSILEKVLGTTQGYGKDPEQYYYDGSFKKVCPSCLKEKKAILAHPEKQLFGLAGPCLMYVDRSLTCKTCKDAFVFKAEEQQDWYEKYKIWISGYPLECLSCRKKTNLTKKRQKELQGKLALLDRNNPFELAKLAEIYLELGKKAKAIEFLRRAKNLTDDVDRKKMLALEIQRLGAAPTGKIGA